MACILARSQPAEFQFVALAQRRVYAASPPVIAEVIDVVKQFASEISKDEPRDVALGVLERARLCLDFTGGHLQHFQKKRFTR